MGVPSFVPSARVHQLETPAAQTSTTASQAQGSAAAAGGAAVVAVMATAAAGGVLRRPAGRSTRPSFSVSRPAVRRELAIAYEDSGIDLIDNGKFCQGLVGAEGAWGRYEFDPLGFSRYTEFVPFLREAELKHGRICMLAFLGLVVPDFVRIPGERYSFEVVPHAIDAHYALAADVGPNAQVLFWISFIEICTWKKVTEWNSLEVAGDYNFGINFFPKDEEGQKKMRLMELKNGRLAMIAFSGAVTQAVLTQHPFPWLY